MTNTTNGVVAQYNGESDLQAEMGSSYINILGSTDGVISGIAQQLAADTINRMVFRDNPRLNQTLETSNTLASLQEVIRQMKIAGATVLAMTITATPAAFTGTGNGIINASVRRPSDGLVLENSFAETLLFTCTSDSYSGSATAGNEEFNVTGTGQQTDVFAFDWPLGSNAQTSLNAIDGDTSNGSGNLLTNSGFTNWTSDVPDNWSLVTGTATTNISKETGLTYSGGAAAKVTGDAGGTLTQIRQKFNDSDGTSGALDPETQYSFNGFFRRDGTAAAAGVLTIDLADSGGTVIKDENGVNNSFTIDLTALTTAYVSYTGVFRTPAIMPSTAYIRMRLTTALTNARSVYWDKCSLGEMTQTYTSGPFAAVHAGATPFLIGDYGTCAITNSRGAAATLSTFQTLCAQLFPDVINSELLFPSSASPTISDSALIA